MPTPSSRPRWWARPIPTMRPPGPGTRGGGAECGTFTTSDGGATWVRGSMTGWDTAWNGDVGWSYSGATSGVSKTLGQDLSDPRAIFWVTPQFAWISTDQGASFT